MRDIVVAITGASGAIYAVQLLKRLHKETQIHIHLLVSGWGERVLNDETGLAVSDIIAMCEPSRLTYYDVSDMGARISSGSFVFDTMVVLPCSTGTMCAIASGLSTNLIERVASVTLKERRALLLVVRETPLSTIHLKHMHELSSCGAILMTPVPAWYLRPQTLTDIVNGTVDRILDHLGVRQKETRRWAGEYE